MLVISDNSSLIFGWSYFSTTNHRNDNLVQFYFEIKYWRAGSLFRFGEVGELLLSHCLFLLLIYMLKYISTVQDQTST